MLDYIVLRPVILRHDIYLTFWSWSRSSSSWFISRLQITHRINGYCLSGWAFADPQAQVPLTSSHHPEINIRRTFAQARKRGSRKHMLQSFSFLSWRSLIQNTCDKFWSRRTLTFRTTSIYWMSMRSFCQTIEERVDCVFVMQANLLPSSHRFWLEDFPISSISLTSAFVYPCKTVLLSWSWIHLFLSSAQIHSLVFPQVLVGCSLNRNSCLLETIASDLPFPLPIEKAIVDPN